MKEPFTPEEKEIMNLITQAHNRFVQLESTHPSEIKDWVNGLHSLQGVLGNRVLRRDYPEIFISKK
jgi:hypothetical protein